MRTTPNKRTDVDVSSVYSFCNNVEARANGDGDGLYSSPSSNKIDLTIFLDHNRHPHTVSCIAPNQRRDCDRRGR